MSRGGDSGYVIIKKRRAFGGTSRMHAKFYWDGRKFVLDYDNEFRYEFRNFDDAMDECCREAAGHIKSGESLELRYFWRRRDDKR